MFFQNRINRAMKFQREKNAAASESQEKDGQLLDPKAEFEDRPLRDKLEKGDIPALILSAGLVFIPVALVVLVGLVLICRLLFGL